MFTCASCTIEACRSGQLDKMPKNCPMRDRAFFDSILEEYFKPENHDFFIASAATEAIGYCRWPRLREVVEFSKCSATRFLRNRDRIVEKKSPILRSISEARSLASTAPQQGERPTQEGGLF